jgi:ferritin-like metal-binding protein YciE
MAVSRCAGYAVFIHGNDPSHHDRRGLLRAALWSAMQRERAGNVPAPVAKGLLFAARLGAAEELKFWRLVAKYPITPRRDSMAREKNLQELFCETLKDIYFAEKKILSALPKMAKAAQSEELKVAFEKHETETEEHVARLEKVFEEIDETPRGKTCDAIMGIIEEGQEVMKEFKGAPALDAGLLAAAQAVEHYEIARYGTLKTWAAELGLNQAMKLLERTLAEEKTTDETLTQLAESQVNQHAQAA